MTVKDEDIQSILKKYEERLSSQIETTEGEIKSSDVFSKEYIIFRNEAMPSNISRYEKLCEFASGIINIKPSQADIEELEKSIELTHVNVTPQMAASFAGFVAMMFALIGLLLGGIMFLFQGLTMSVMTTVLIFIVTGVALMKPITNYPNTIATNWRLKASNQMVLCILYIVMYMRHTSNLEHAIKFAGEHIGNPLALDLRKVFWDVESGKYATMKESIDKYLAKWKGYNIEFVEAFHLIESSLYEPSEEKRLDRLEKALTVMLEGTYENMMHFAHNVSSPITMLHMLGIILPILGLIILPLVGSFLGVRWWHLSLLYNLLLPLAVYYFGTNLLAKRPTGYGESSVMEESGMYDQYKYVNLFGYRVQPKLPAILLGMAIIMIGLLPLMIHFVVPGYDLSVFGFKFLDYRTVDGKALGPFGVGAAMFSLFVPLGMAFGLGLYYKLSTKTLILIRNKTKALEKEFASSLFQLGNRIGDGMPAEMAFGKVAENMRDTTTGDFLNIVNVNIRKLGMDVRSAVFDSERGAILSYPSNLIESSMKVLLESSRKGPEIVAKSLISISDYVDRIHKVAERLKDLLADITSSMKGQLTFLTPLIAGVVVGIGSMITTIIGNLGTELKTLAGGGESTGLNIAEIVGLFPPDKIMPPYYFQIVVGVFVVEITVILSILSNSVENGLDEIQEQNNIGKNLYFSVPLYIAISFMVMAVFNLLVQMIAPAAGG